MEQSLSDAPLPPGWDEAVFGKANTKYFIDHVNKVCSYHFVLYIKFTFL